MSLLNAHFEDVTISACQQAIIDATCLAIMADGRITAGEEAYAVRSISELLRVEDAHAIALAQQSFARIELDREDVLHGLADIAMTSQEIEAVFMAAAYISLDEGLFLDEKVFLFRLGGVLNLEPDETDYLLDLAKDRLSGAEE